MHKYVIGLCSPSLLSLQTMNNHYWPEAQNWDSSYIELYARVYHEAIYALLKFSAWNINFLVKIDWDLLIRVIKNGHQSMGINIASDLLMLCQTFNWNRLLRRLSRVNLFEKRLKYRGTGAIEHRLRKWFWAFVFNFHSLVYFVSLTRSKAKLEVSLVENLD